MYTQEFFSMIYHNIAHHSHLLDIQKNKHKFTTSMLSKIWIKVATTIEMIIYHLTTFPQIFGNNTNKMS